MEASPLFQPAQDKADPLPAADARLQPTPDYGTLGPGSDIAGPHPPVGASPARKKLPWIVQLVAALSGAVAALVAGTVLHAKPVWPRLGHVFSTRQSEPASPKDLHQLDSMKPQKQAETLLELAVGHSDGAVEQISSRADRWQGKVQWNPQIATLTTAALNSNDLRVRQSGVEVELAAYGLSKNDASLNYLLETSDSPDHSQKIWALWALGLMANRGVESERVVEVLAGHLHDADIESRHWAVEGLALAGTDSALTPLLNAMHDDASPLVRERAACSLASSGLFTPDQKMVAVSQLITYTDDPALDAQTHGWAFQALSEITNQRLPRDPQAWRDWYAHSGLSR